MTRAKKGERYWWIGVDGRIYWSEDLCDGDGVDAKLSDIGNRFNTKEEAERMARKLRAVLSGAEVIGPMLDDDKFATEATFDENCKIIPPKNHLIGTIVTTDRGIIVEYIDKLKIVK